MASDVDPQSQNGQIVFSASAAESTESLLNCESIRVLPSFLRVLLTTDGTVTKSLEAYFWEPIRVEPIAQAYVDGASSSSALRNSAGKGLLQRKVRLVGVDSDTQYVEADSYIDTSIIPEDLKQKLDKRELGIGELLIQKGMDTHRELIEVGFISDSEVIWRKYLIWRDGQAFIEIKECFDISHYK